MVEPIQTTNGVWYVHPTVEVRGVNHQKLPICRHCGQPDAYGLTSILSEGDVMELIMSSTTAAQPNVRWC